MAHKKVSTVSTARDEYTNAKVDVDRNRDAVKGERAIKAKTTVYLPPLNSMCCETVTSGDVTKVSVGTNVSNEGQASYNKYLTLSQFYGATGRTVDGLVGLIYSKDAVSELPPTVDYMEKNVDSRGTTLRDFSKAASTEAFISPWSGILVARPSTPEGSSNKDVEDQNIRAKLLHYKFDSIINWDFTVVNNV